MRDRAAKKMTAVGWPNVRAYTPIRSSKHGVCPLELHDRLLALQHMQARQDACLRNQGGRRDQQIIFPRASVDGTDVFLTAIQTTRMAVLALLILYLMLNTSGRLF